MMESELQPIFSGVLLGSLLGYVRPSLRVRLGVASALVLGAIATILSGEILVAGWYVLIDVSLVAVSAAVALTLVHRLRWVRS